MELKIKKELENAVIPKYESAGAACFDLVAATAKSELSKTGPLEIYDTGLSFEIPPGHVGLVFPRSSITTKTTLMLGNGVGIIDSDYRGTVKFQYRQVNNAVRLIYKPGDRIGQMMILPIPAVSLLEVNELSETVRGEGGFGSSGV